jgi:phenylacetate-CoA ligase
MLIGAECEAHDGLHVSMEKLIVEILVKNPDGSWRTAAPGETGEVVITDLHNLAVPFIRYQTGDQAIAREQTPCSCGRTLDRIGPIDGRLTETLRDGQGNRVSGLIFNILFVYITEHVRQFQAVQRADSSLVLRVVLPEGQTRLNQEAAGFARDYIGKYLPGIRFDIDVVDEIATTAAGKRRLVVVET